MVLQPKELSNFDNDVISLIGMKIEVERIFVTISSPTCSWQHFYCLCIVIYGKTKKVPLHPDSTGKYAISES